MFQITYPVLAAIISILWILVRFYCFKKSKIFSWKREAQLMLVYICIVVVVRFTFFPFFKVDGRIPPLVFDPATVFPLRLNFVPLVNLFDYEIFKELLINVIGNTAMFLPLGIVWPSVFKELNTHGKVIGAGIGCSLLIEILQLPFFDRVSDVDDLILNTLGCVIGYGILTLCRRCKRKALLQDSKILR